MATSKATMSATLSAAVAALVFWRRKKTNPKATGTFRTCAAR